MQVSRRRASPSSSLGPFRLAAARSHIRKTPREGCEPPISNGYPPSRKLAHRYAKKAAAHPW
jgi:hypothetical protein